MLLKEMILLNRSTDAVIGTMEMLMVMKLMRNDIVADETDV